RGRAKEIARTWPFRRLHSLFRSAPRPRLVTPINIIGLLERPYHAKMVLPSDFLLPDADGTDSKRRRSTQHDFNVIAEIRICRERLHQIPHTRTLYRIGFNNVD